LIFKFKKIKNFSYISNVNDPSEKSAQASAYVPSRLVIGRLVTCLTFYLLSTAPDESIREAAKLYFELGLSDVQIVDQLSDHYDTEQYGLRYINFSSRGAIVIRVIMGQCCHVPPTAKAMGFSIYSPAKAYSGDHF
jgi:hypothetical protein